MLAAVRTSFTATLDRRRRARDEALTRWMGALVLVVGAVLTGVLLALVPPTAEGDWGWIVAAVVITLRLAAAAGLATGRGPVRYGRRLRHQRARASPACACSSPSPRRRPTSTTSS